MFRHYSLCFVQGRRPVEIATESKDAVFGSTFNLDEVNILCNIYGLKFAHNM
ncbi:hypothetical protein RMCBS344292_19080 [Rhizopus microsporus]|nr:hypothetical protein RMCBS344292_19080 [Rhizopus microsporus]